MRELKAHRIKKQIKILEQELIEHQEKCKHIKVIKEAKSNTGHYDTSNNCYWYKCFCPTCLKVWDEDQ